MGGDLPKVLYRVAGQPMIRWIVRACRQAGVGRCIIVAGYQGERVRQALEQESHCVFVTQAEQKGTAHATRAAQGLCSAEADVFVLNGDGPLIRATVLSRLFELHRRTGSSATLATAVIDDPTGYGRVVRSASGDFEQIVEHNDATPEQLQIKEVNPGYYCFRCGPLFAALAEVDNQNRKGEYYLTAVPALLKRQGQVVSVVHAVPPEDALSVNTPEQQAEVDRILRRRLAGRSQPRQTPV